MSRPEIMELEGVSLIAQWVEIQESQRMVNIINNKYDFLSNRTDLNEQEKQKINNIWWNNWAP